MTEAGLTECKSAVTTACFLLLASQNQDTISLSLFSSQHRPSTCLLHLPVYWVLLRGRHCICTGLHNMERLPVWCWLHGPCNPRDALRARWVRSAEPLSVLMSEFLAWGQCSSSCNPGHFPQSDPQSHSVITSEFLAWGQCLSSCNPGHFPQSDPQSHSVITSEFLAHSRQHWTPPPNRLILDAQMFKEIWIFLFFLFYRCGVHRLNVQPMSNSLRLEIACVF
jgi:hypothetical protein